MQAILQKVYNIHNIDNEQLGSELNWKFMVEIKTNCVWDVSRYINKLSEMLAHIR